MVVGLGLARPTAFAPVRGLGLLLSAAIVLQLLVATRREQRDAARLGAAGEPPAAVIGRVGVMLVVVPLYLPAVYGWYLGAALFLLAAGGRHGSPQAVLVLSSGLAFSSLKAALVEDDGHARSVDTFSLPGQCQAAVTPLPLGPSTRG